MAGSALYLGHRTGIVSGLAAPAAEAALLLLVSSARIALLGAFLVGMVAEDDPSWGVNLSAVYNHGTAQPSPFEALEAIAAVAVLLHLVATRLPPRMPRPFGPVLTVTALALVAGVVQGATAGATQSGLLSTVEGTAPLILIPVLVVNVVRSRDELRVALAIGVALAGFKAFAGLFVYFSHLAPVEGGFGRLTYFQAPANLLMMLMLMGMLVAAAARVPVPRWTKLLAPVAFIAIVLSFRRTIWLGTAIGTAVIAFPALGYVGRRIAVPSLALVIAAGYLVLSTGLGGGLQGPLVTRAESISLSKISANDQDRYRIDERRNVLAAIEREPLTGLGIGIPWPERYPVGLSFVDQQDFTHIGALFWWMKMGILGLVAYLLTIGAMVAAGARVWLRHPDADVRAFGLAAAGFAVGLAVVELANTVLADSERGSMLYGVVLGLLAVAYAQLTDSRPAAPLLFDNDR
jgi:O-antigen ligase